MPQSANIVVPISMGVFLLCWIFAIWNVILVARVARPPGESSPTLLQIIENDEDPARPYVKRIIGAYFLAAVSWFFAFNGGTVF
jgi:hypothetical protein